MATVNTMSSEKIYLKEIAKIPLLSKEEEVALAEAVRNGSEEAKNKLVEHNLRLVVSIAKGYMGRGLSFLDLVQEGNCGLMNAVDSYNLDKGFRFSTWATYCIKGAISKAVMEQGRNIRIPVHVITLMSNIKKTERSFQQEHGRNPSEFEVAAILDIEVKKIKEAYKWMKDTTSLDIMVGDEEDTTIGSFIEDESVSANFTEVEMKDRTEAIKTLLDTLSERERNVIIRRFGIGMNRAMTLEEIAKEFKFSRETIRQAEISALKKLRNPRRANLLKDFIA